MLGLKLHATLVVSLAAFLVGGAYATNGNTRTAVPGTVNYVEGAVALDGNTLNSKSVGSAEVNAGQSISTETGKTEFLLTPGVYVRLGDNSKATLVSPSLTATQLSIDKGEAMVEVDELHKQNNIQIVENGVSTELVKTGLYDFNSDKNTVQVFSGQADVQENDQNIKVKGGHELDLQSSGHLKTAKFNKGEAEGSDLYRWSSLRSDYLAEANIDAAGVYFANGWYGPGWIGTGWYWDPWLAGYTFLPGEGAFFNPFGWGFYSPRFVYNSPLWYRGYYGRQVAGVHPPVREGVGPVGHSTSARGGGSRGGEGFHGGGTSFHGGGGFEHSGGMGFGGHR
jgi:hypothetical protein